MKIITIAIILVTLTILSFIISEYRIEIIRQELRGLDYQLQLLKLRQEKLKQSLEETASKTLGKASWYDYILKDGWSSVGHYVCASRDYPRRSKLLVTNLANNKSIACVVTDYGPNKSIHPDRIIDLSSASFSAISDLKLGIINVSVKQYVN